MLLQSTLILSLVTASLSSPVALKTALNGTSINATYIHCTEASTDPLCHLVRQPNLDVLTEIVHTNGTVEVKRNLYTREQLKEIRNHNNVASIEQQPGDVVHNGSVAKRDSGPSICWTETQRWFDQQQWGYWYQNWHQVGNCFYCDQCTESISASFGVSETWTWGLSAEIGGAITASFGFSWGETHTLTDTRTCQWNWVEYGCHSIWYQPLMSWHNGYANYQTHQHCSGGDGSGASDVYYNHNWAWANVNQAGNNGINQGNLGCGSGCSGSGHRQCSNGNNGGSLWPYPN